MRIEREENMVTLATAMDKNGSPFLEEKIADYASEIPENEIQQTLAEMKRRDYIENLEAGMVRISEKRL